VIFINGQRLIRFYLCHPMSKLLNRRSDKPVAIWLLTGVFMIIVQIVLGGITRLTDSGLSITEWKPILGAVPPIGEQQWMEAFNHYKQIAQYKNLHAYFTLGDFKAIYFWEWFHRLWGRFLGIVFLIPFIIFLVQRRFTRAMIQPMIVLFLLGALQGLVGWVMVKSGLNEEDNYVSHIRLAVHFIVALGLLVYTFWFALQLLVPAQEKLERPGARKLIVFILALLVLQLIYGALMAGLKAANAAPTWPSINGSFVPADFLHYGGVSYSFFKALFYNPLAVHFVHRNLAYLIFLCIVVWTFSVRRQNGSRVFSVARWLPLLLVCLQVGLGIAALLTSPEKRPQHWGIFDWNAQWHQFVAILLLLSLVLVLFLLLPLQNAKSSKAIDNHLI
jgi:cytochrome c oxidase assembly protein subunit 15